MHVKCHHKLSPLYYLIFQIDISCLNICIFILFSFVMILQIKQNKKTDEKTHQQNIKRNVHLKAAWNVWNSIIHFISCDQSDWELSCLNAVFDRQTILIAICWKSKLQKCRKKTTHTLGTKFWHSNKSAVFFLLT